VPARIVHLVRHGEVHNPAGVIYGRLPGFRLSDRGELMAAAAADALRGEPVTRVVASPLLRTQQSAQPIAEAFGLPIESDDRLIENDNVFEGRVSGGSLAASPRDWKYFVNPFRPSWGEPYTGLLARMLAGVTEAAAATDDGALVVVSHQLPIWILHLGVAGRVLAHNPSRRRCALSSITTFAVRDDGLVETAYADPAARVPRVDVGAAP
jgi:broad specificity phosphatase PhoE